jgi:glycosyltransferase involved in cell wall biosynthesis
MNVSVVFCVVQDSTTFQECLDSYTVALNFYKDKKNSDEIEPELFVVYNGPTGDFDRFTSIFKSRHSDFGANFQILSSPEYNLSKARNMALEKSSREWILFLDDDCTVDPLILVELDKTLTECNVREIKVAGGRVLLSGDFGLTEFHKAWLSKLDLGTPSRVIQNSYVNGANFLVNRVEALSAGSFDAALGRQRNLLISGEETDLINRITKKHPGIYYNHDQIVTQIVPTNRRERTYLGKRIMWEAVTRALILQKDSPELGDRRSWKTPSDRNLDRLLQECTQLLVFGEMKKKMNFISIARNFLSDLKNRKLFSD